MPGRQRDKSRRPNPRRWCGRGEPPAEHPNPPLPGAAVTARPPGRPGVGAAEGPGSCEAVAQRPDDRRFPRPRGGRAVRGGEGDAEGLAVQWGRGAPGVSTAWLDRERVCCATCCLVQILALPLTSLWATYFAPRHLGFFLCERDYGL